MVFCLPAALGVYRPSEGLPPQEVHLRRVALQALLEVHLRRVVPRALVLQLAPREFHKPVTSASPLGSTANMTMPCASWPTSAHRKVSLHGLVTVPFLRVEQVRLEVLPLPGVFQVQREERRHPGVTQIWEEQPQLGVVLVPVARVTSRKSKVPRVSAWPRWPPYRVLRVMLAVQTT